MLVLNFMYMKKSLFRFSSRRILFSTVIASALIAGGSQAVFADAGGSASRNCRLVQLKVKSWIPMASPLSVLMLW